MGIKIEGDLCPICRYRLKNDYHGEYDRYPVTVSEFSIRSRKGIGVVPPVDPNNQDTSVLSGSVDISKMDLYSEDDPRVLSLNGAFNVGNRGLVEFIEVFKNDVEYLHTMITATQEKSIPSPGKGSMIYFDGIILAHSNEAEWNKFKSAYGTVTGTPADVYDSDSYWTGTNVPTGLSKWKFPIVWNLMKK